MSSHDDVDRSVARWLESEARPAATADVLDRALRATRQRRPRPRLSARFGSHWVGDGAASPGRVVWRTGVRTSTALVVLLLVVVALAGAVAVGARLLQPARADLGIFAPVAGRIVYGDGRVIWGIDPAAPADRRTNTELNVHGTPLEWSSDGTRLLIMRGRGSDEHLFVLDADGSETQVTERPMEIQGATISPDGSRVVYNDSGALYSVSADGGPVGILLRARHGILRDPIFAPDGTHIAYVDGRGDWGNDVWVVNVDGSDAHPIMTNETTDGAGHTSGLAWAPSGDRIALGLQGAIYTFAADGSGFTQVISLGDRPYWSPDGSQIGYRVPCPEPPGACGLAIADADGSDARTFGFGTSGPWHPAPLQTDETSDPLSPDEIVLHLQSWREGFKEAAVYADGRLIWIADERVGYLEQQLTPAGVERLRSTAISTGLFERDLALGIDALGFGAFEVRRGDLTVIVTWGSGPVDVSSRDVEAHLVHASPAQALKVSELEAFLSDPTTWSLADDMYVFPEIRPFVPSHLWVSYDRSRPDLSNLPSPAREVVTRILGPWLMDDCQNISLDQAQEIAHVLAQAGIIAPDDDVRLGLAFDVPSPPSFVHAHPALPHDVGTACEEG